MRTFVKQGPFGVNAFPKSLNELFDTLVQDANAPVREDALFPKTDIAETEKAYELNIILPGIKKEDIQIDVVDNKLVVKGERKRLSEEETKKYHKVESLYGKYERSFILPKHSNSSEISATQADGVLTVIIPKSEVEITAKKIEVK
ncbi:MAG: Hsp20/alpha crystallin family protein [Cytophagales bacterium]|nr:Hsp20/alpha crystallin family protein [Cytophaga sp.]